MSESGNDGDRAQWNVLVTAQEGAARDLKRLVQRYGAFRWSAFRNVLLGQVPEPASFFQALAAELERKPFVSRWLGKALPIMMTFPVRPESFLTDAESRLAVLAHDLKGKTFHVRVERRGHKGELHTADLEHRLGEFLWELLEKEQAKPAVSFNDPDVVVAVEIAGATAGIAVIPRKLRENFPFVKID
jgi:tRNA(Ser,Leu) C12 N-acetylase TAN1